MWKLFDKNPHVSITKNLGHLTYIILRGLLGKKIIFDIISVYPKLRGYALEKQSQVFILHNNEETGGIDIFYKFLFDSLHSDVNIKKENRNGMMLFVLLLSCWTQSIVVFFSLR